MRVLFCSDAMIVDGVTSFVFHLATALKESGHDVAVLGRWAGRGFQSRLKEHGVAVIQCVSPTVGNFWFDKKAAEFRPDVLVTDSRRSFPLATRLKKVTGAKVFTFFLDRLEKTNRKGRDIGSLIKYSDVWLSAEKPLLSELAKIPTPFPKVYLQRPLKGLFVPTEIRPRDPFRLLCFGRISKFKSVTSMSLLNNALYMKKHIPSLEMVFLGGGWRTVKFRFLATQINYKAGVNFVKIAGTQTDPSFWLEWATIVCAGSTSAVEAILTNRPVIASTGYYLGLLTPGRLDDALATYFAERGGTLLSDNPDTIIDEVIRTYQRWDDETMKKDTARVRETIEPFYERETAAQEFKQVFDLISSGKNTIHEVTEKSLFQGGFQ